MRKRERQQLIASLVRQEGFSTQQQLVAALGKMGFRITQATVSRDLRELGVQKVAGRRGKARLQISQANGQRNRRAVLSRVLRESEAHWQEAQNLVVIQLQPGAAPSIGRVLDELGHPDVIGTVAGDDTVLVVLADATKAKKMVDFFTETIAKPNDFASEFGIGDAE